MLHENIDKAVNLYNSQKPPSSKAKKTPIGFENELELQQLRMLEMSERSATVNELSESSRPSKSQKKRPENPDVVSTK